MNVVLVVFRRPDTTRRVFERIREARPERLFLVADGPRNSEEAALCREVRSIISNVDWDCDVKIDFSDKNLGCRWRMITGLNRVFEQVEDAIILEDDCLPHPSFFRFARELLDYYREDRRIMHIGGSCFVEKDRSASYYFSRYTHVWGWATWRRAWSHFDVSMAEWPAFRAANQLKDILADVRAEKAWTGLFEDMVHGRAQTVWDYAWTFTCWRTRGLTVVPAVNLVSNIGFGAGGTHTPADLDLMRVANLRTHDIGPIRHPLAVAVDRAADRETFEFLFLWQPPLRVRLWRAVFSRWTYGRILRRIPMLGSLWAKWRLADVSRRGEAS